MPRKIIPMPKDSFPELVCGTCAYGNYEKTKALNKLFYCWESPPVPVVDEGVVDFKRGFEVEPTDNACRNFKPRCHG